MEEEDTLVVHVPKEMVLKRIQMLKLKRFGLRNPRMISGSWIVDAQDT